MTVRQTGVAMVRLAWVALALVTLSCGETRPAGGDAAPEAPLVSSTRSGVIQADPNPVPPGSGHGTTTVTWKTSDGTVGEIYLYLPDQPNAAEQLFARGAAGSQEAPWIASNVTYEFRFYEGTARKRLLGTVKVTRSAE